MTPEYIERTIEFILNLQANSEVRLEQTQEQLQALTGIVHTVVQQVHTVAQQMEARDQRLSANIEKISDEVRLLKEACRDLLDIAHRADVRLNRLENSET